MRFTSKYILYVITLLLVYSCNKTSQTEFILDPSKPVEVGIESISDLDQENMKINIYMINHSPVAGVQFELAPNSFFEVDTVFGGRCEENNFSLRSNKQGRILGFSMKGDHIPESNSANSSFASSNASAALTRRFSVYAIFESPLA